MGKRRTTYSCTSALTERICEEIGWIFEMHAIETLSRKGKIYVQGTLLKPQEARELESFCANHGYVYLGPFAR